LEIGTSDLVGENETVSIKTGNQDALSLANNPEFHDKTKHSNAGSETSSQQRLQG
jgi:hypothetical protein